MASVIDRIRSFLRPTVMQISLGSDAPTQVLNYTAKQLYNSQDNLSAVVNFLANSVAQLPLKVYTRNGETERERDRTGTVAKLLWKPNADQTAFEFIRGLAIEYFVFGCVYVWVIPDQESESGWQMRIIPTDWVKGTKAASAYRLERITVSASGQYVDIPGSEIIDFKTYSAGNPAGYVSPISSLRQTLQEQIEAGKFRRQLWSSSGRLNAYITRPANVAAWDDESRKRFVEAFREGWGPNGSKAGSMPLLEDGMEIKPYQTSFREQQWAESIKLSREAVAAAYMINPSLIWHTDTQTYASSKDNARALYAECLGPTLQMFQQRINGFLIPMVGGDPERTYAEFDLTEKLKGSFEERASILQSAVGGPWMTRNEARADNNLPPVDGGDDLIVPLNVVQGGQASPTDTHMDEQEPMAIEPAKACGCKSCKAAPILIKGKSDEEEDEQTAATLAAFFRRQAKSVLPKIGAGADWWDAERWNAELADDLEPVMDAIADKHGAEAAKEIGSEYGTEVTRNYLKAMASGRAAAYNAATRKKLAAVLEDDEAEEDPADVFQKREETDSGTLGRSLATAVASWAILEAAHQAENDDRIPRGRIVEKEWVTGDNPRPSHAAMDGERVSIDANFSNGAYWPGDDVLGPDETCGCNCSTEILITEV